MYTQLLLASLLPLVSAHFKLIYPAARGFDEDTLGTFPCGGQDTVSSNRTQFPINGAPIQLYMGHTSAHVQVLLAMGNEPGDNFNVTIVPTFQEYGPQNFCMGAGAIQWPEGINTTALEGMNATMQVVTNGDPTGGLYNCADITFTSTALTTAEYNADCQNSTGIKVAAMTVSVNANETTESSGTDAASSSGTSSSSATASAASGSATASGSSTGAGARATLAGWALGAVGVFAGVAAL